MNALLEVDARIGALLHEYGSPDLCLAEALCDRHPAANVAFSVIAGDGSASDLTFGELRERSRRLASALEALGVRPGDRVATLMTKSADLVTALLAIWRAGAVYVPLFTAFAAPAVAMRLAASGTKVAFVDAAQRAKLDGDAGSAGPSLQAIIVAGGARRFHADAASPMAGAGAVGPATARGDAAAAGARTAADASAAADADIAFEDAIAGHEPQAAPVRAGGAAPFVRLFTSGTTGEPKGVVIPARAIASFVVYQEFGLDVRPDDVFWNAADPGWAYGLYYALCAPLATGRRGLLLSAPFSAELTYQILERFDVTNFAAAPTVYRALRAAGAPPPGRLALRCASSAGEPLGAELVTWARAALGVPIHDQYGQTELGMAVVNGHHPSIAAPLKPGSMGRAMPGWDVAILSESSDSAAPAGELGRVAVDLPRSPLMWFERYADAPERTAERFIGDRWYLTGDAGSIDDEGYVFFSARDDDVIIMAGYRIGPFEIESVLHEHAAVAESAVIGVPDELRGEVVEAFVVLRPGIAETPELVLELQRHVKERYAAHAYPRRIHFLAELPKTPSGKLQRFLLRNAARAQTSRP
jgi:acetyl-CoA synthetase